VREVEVTHRNGAAPARRQAGDPDDLGNDAREVCFGLFAEGMILTRRLIRAGIHAQGRDPTRSAGEERARMSTG